MILMIERRKNVMTKKKANFILICVTIIWGGGFIATDRALESFSPFSVMAVRFLGAAFLPFLISWRDIRSLPFRYLKEGVFTGIMLFLAFALQTFGLQLSTPSKNAFLTATNVIFVPYLLWLLAKRKPSRKELLSSVLCIVGIAMLVWKPDMLFLQFGDMLSLLCALFFALHIIALERYTPYIPTVAFTALQMLISGILSIICAVIFEEVPHEITSSAFMSALYLIFISTLLAYLLQTAAQKHTTANSAALILSMEALFASVFSFLLLHEAMTVNMVLGAFFILASVIFMEYDPKGRRL